MRLNIKSSIERTKVFCFILTRFPGGLVLEVKFDTMSVYQAIITSSQRSKLNSKELSKILAYTSIVTYGKYASQLLIKWQYLIIRYHEMANKVLKMQVHMANFELCL